MIIARIGIVLIVAAVAFGAASSTARAVPPGYSVEAVHTGLSFPVALRFAPDGRLFILERDGRILMCADSGYAAPVVWDTVSAYTPLEMGALGLDFHPDFPDSPYVYVFHTPNEPYSRIARIRDLGDHGSGYAVIRYIPRSAQIHVSGRIAFGPDNDLYVTSGDQEQSAIAQDPGSLWGKLLRLTPMGKPAPGNPFPVTPEIAAIGIRNAFGLCFDPVEGSGFTTENGTGCNDEINRVLVGANYGWPPAASCGPQAIGTEPPLVQFTQTIAPTGCCVYRGAAYPDLDGDLFVASWAYLPSSGEHGLYRVAFHPGSRTVVDSVSVFHAFPTHDRVLDVTVGPDGLLWAATAEWSPPGTIWRIVPPVVTGVIGATSNDALRVWPNPFARSVVIQWPADLAIERLEIIDLHGRAIRRWSRPAGRVTWDGRDRDGNAAGPGIYFARATGAGAVFSRRVVRLVP